MTEITNQTIGQYRIKGVWSITGSISADNNSKLMKESKSFTLRFTLDNELSDLMHPALSTKKINWAASKAGRESIEKLKDGAVIELSFASPGRTQADPEEVMASRLQAMTPEARKQWFESKGIKF